MWKDSNYPLGNLMYSLFWEPKNNVIYKSRDKTYYSHGNAGYILGTVTSVYFIGKDSKERECSFRIQDNKVSIKIGKKIKYFDKSRLSFSKKVSRSTYWGQGGGSIRGFVYRVTLKK